MRPAFDKKTFNINREYNNLMKAIVPSRKQTEFVNRAIKHELEREQEKIEREKTLLSLGELRKKRQSMPKPVMKSEDIVRTLREESIDGKYQTAINHANDE